MAAPRYQDSLAVNRTPPDFAAAQTADVAAQSLGALRSALTQFTGQRQAQRGTIAGAQAGAEGTPSLRSSFTAYGAAFNNSAIRNYLISKQTEAEVELGRIENDAGADPAKFQALADGVRRGALKNALPAARGMLSNIYQSRIAEGVVRVDAKRVTQQRQENRAMLQQGLDTISDSVSRRMATGDPVLMRQAEEDAVQMTVMIDSGVRTGDLTPAEAVTLKAEGAKRVTQQMIIGGFEREIRNGDPVAYIGKVMTQPAENLSDAEKQQLTGQLFERLNRYQALVSESKQFSDLEQKARWKKGEQDATVATLRRQITTNDLARMVENDEISPSVARTLSNDLSSPSKGADDQALKMQVETNLLHYSEEDISGMGALSNQTRADLILKRRQEAEGWKSDQGAQEALRRIDVALGIPSGLGPQFTISLTPEKATAAAKARSYFYDLVESTPPEQRKASYFELADKAVNELGKEVKRSDLERQQRTLQSYLKQVGRPEDMNETQRKEYDATVKRRTEAIQQLEQEIGQ